MASGRKPKADAVSNPTTGGPIGQVSAGDGVKAIDAVAPFGGMKESGLGREGAAEGIDEYLTNFLISQVYSPALNAGFVIPDMSIENESDQLSITVGIVEHFQTVRCCE
jgi:hypothetical protein